MILAPANVDGLLPALNHAGPDALEFSGAYFISRMLLSERGHALSFANLLCKVIAVVALIGALDPIFGRYVIHDLAQQLTGYVSPAARTEWSDAYRMGLLRASGPIEHPIWFGFICGIGLLLAASIPIQRRLFVIGSCSIGVMLSLSSAPIQCTLLGLGLLTYDRMFYRFQIRWALILGISGAVVFAVYLITNSPIGFIISHFTFDPSTGYYRVWTWATVTPYIAQSPWFGLGFGTLPDELNHSIDELWLVLGIHYGWPGAILVALSITFAAAVPTRRPYLDLTENERKLGTTLGIISFLTLFFACTVDILGILWTLTGLFAGVSAHLGELGRLRRSKSKAMTSNVAPTEQAVYARSSGAYR
ncbi:MAG TPA: hypothetical protein VFA65_15160 [Bryobacteraceae bacterium]|nr:hypothetical protein [Bryobacteraceae bacterium]